MLNYQNTEKYRSQGVLVTYHKRKKKGVLNRPSLVYQGIMYLHFGKRVRA